MFELGTVPFSATSEWNQMVAPGATYTKLNWPASTGYNYNVNWDHYSPALYVATASDPIVQVRVPDSWGHPGGTISVRMPRDATGAVGTDGELLVIDGDRVYNFWQFERTGTNSATAASYGWTNIVTGTGWGSQAPFLGAGTTAIGSSQLSGLLVQAETDAGEINHALQLVVDYELVKPGFSGDAIAGDGGNPNGIVREGDHLGIPPGTPMPAGLSELGQKVFRALQQYGAYVVDVAGGTTVLRAQANAYDMETMDLLWADMGKVLPMLQSVTGGTVAAETPPPATDTQTPTVLATIVASGAGISEGNGHINSGNVQLALSFNNAVNVSGTPTLALNDGGTARYVSGAGTKTLVFDYQVAAGRNTADLAVSTFNLGGVTDLSGKAVSLTNAPRNPAGTLTIDTKAPTLASIVASGAGISNGNGTLQNGTVRLSLAFDEAVNVSGSPTLNLNNGGVATYVGGNGTKTLAFDYQIGAGQNVADLAVSGFNLGGVRDVAGNALNLSGAPTNPPGTLQIQTAAAPSPNPTPNPTPTPDPTPTPNPNPTLPDPTSPTQPPVADVTRPTVDGVEVNSWNARKGTITLNMSEDVVVRGVPVLQLRDGTKAVYSGGSGTDTLTFTYNAKRGFRTEPTIAGAKMSGSSSIRDLAGNKADLSGALTSQGSRDLGRAGGYTTNPTSFADVASGFRTTLAFKPNDHGSRSQGTDMLNAAKLQLFGQYIASSFASSGPATAGTSAQDPNTSGFNSWLTRSS